MAVTRLIYFLSRGTSTSWRLLGCVLVALAAVELLLRLLLGAETPSGDTRARADAYANEPWATSLLDEAARSAAVDWTPYVYWRRRPFEGRYTHVDSAGLRRTWNAPAAAVRPHRIFFFGGSTAWGSGARDEHTIPSELSRLIHGRGFPVEVVNFGETGYVMTQEVVALLLELQKGNIPDIVVFYDGVNDVFSSLQNGRAGFPQNEANRVAEFNLLGSQARLLKTTGASILARSGIGRLARRLAAANGPAPAEPAPEALVEDTVRVYAANVALVEGLARNHGFRSLFIWQPAVFTKRSLTPYEREREAEYLFIKPFFLAVSERVRRDNALRANSAFSTLTDLFANVPEPRFLDFCHASETANREIAERIAERVTPLVSSRGRRAFLSDSDRRNKAAVGYLKAMARPGGEPSHAAIRTRRQSLFDELQR